MSNEPRFSIASERWPSRRVPTSTRRTSPSRRHFATLGLDSIRMVELGVRLEQMFGEAVVLDDWIDQEAAREGRRLYRRLAADVHRRFPGTADAAAAYRVRVVSLYIYEREDVPHRRMGRENRWFHGFVRP